MYKKRKNNWQKHIDCIVLDTILLLLSIWIATTIRNNSTAIFTYKIYREMCFVVVILNFLYISLAKPYSGIAFRSFATEIKEVIKHISFIVIGFLLFCFVCKISTQVSRIAIVLFAIYASLLLLFGHELIKLIVKKYCLTQHSRKILLACNYEDAEMFLSKIEQRNPTGFDIEGIILFSNSKQKAINNIPIVAKSCEKSIEFLNSSTTGEIVLFQPNAKSYFNELLETCEIMGLTTHIIIKNFNYESQVFDKIAGFNTISSCMRLVSSTDMFLKRTMDIIGSIIGLFITGILLIFVAPAIYLTDPGPIFFKQTRIGKDGNPFTLYKFRSMYRDAEARKSEYMKQNEMSGQIFKIKNDPRIIGSGIDGSKKGVGWFIRSFSIDEFPQFYNVLKGDMSLVGTRPPTVDEWKLYELHHKKRMRIKPGVTGLWQTSGRNDITDFEEIVKLDTKYIREWSILLDIKIILKTIYVVLSRNGS